jgi:hypothetical protein
MISVFLSSTFKDFDDYRKDVSEALEDAGWVRAVRLEHAAGAYDDTVDICEREFKMSNAFLLLLAHWYGSIPPAQSKSVTHMEFEWAWQRWKDQKRRPMAVLMPWDGSPADLELKDRTEALLRGATADYQKDHPKRLADFRQQVTQNWKRITYFPTRERAAQKALIAYFDWKGNTPMRAATAHGVPERGDGLLSNSSLGGLGRHTQIDAFRREVSRLKLNATAPGAAFLLTGDELSGQGEFLAHLIRSDAIAGRPARIVLLPSSEYPAEKLVDWASEQFGFAESDRAGTVEDLARKVADELQKQSLSLVLGSLEHLSGGVPAFQQQFWKPLYEELTSLKSRRPFKHRVLAISAAFEEVQEMWTGMLHKYNRHAPPASYDCPILLPELGEIAADDVAQWLEENQVIVEHRGSVVAQVMKGKESVPARSAFERLKRQNLPCEEGEID